MQYVYNICVCIHMYVYIYVYISKVIQLQYMNMYHRTCQAALPGRRRGAGLHLRRGPIAIMIYTYNKYTYNTTNNHITYV